MPIGNTIDFTNPTNPNLGGYLTPNTGLLSGIAQGLQSAIEGYQGERRYQATQQQLALENKLKQKEYAFNLAKAGMQENPEADTRDSQPFTYTPQYLQMLKAQQEYAQRQGIQKAEQAANVEGLKAGGSGLLFPNAYSAVPFNLPGQQSTEPQSQGLLGAQPDTSIFTNSPVRRKMVAEAANAENQAIESGRKVNDPLNQLPSELDKTQAESIGKERSQALSAANDATALKSKYDEIIQKGENNLTDKDKALLTKIGEEAVKTLNGGSVRGGEPYNNMLDFFSPIRKNPPYLGRQYALFSDALGNAIQTSVGKYQSQGQQLKQAVPNYQPPDVSNQPTSVAANRMSDLGNRPSQVSASDWKRATPYEKQQLIKHFSKNQSAGLLGQ